jgi:hypothetical protein
LPDLRRIWPSDSQEWRLNSHHGIEARFLCSNKLAADIRKFFEFLGWAREDDMWAVALSEATHIRKPATAMSYLYLTAEAQGVGDASPTVFHVKYAPGRARRHNNPGSLRLLRQRNPRVPEDPLDTWTPPRV